MYKRQTLYNVGVSTINEHIKKVFGDNELQEDVTIRKFRIVQQEGSRQVGRAVNHYSLQMIIAVGFKVNSERAVQFRKWVNQIAKEYTIKGWAMDDERLKRGTYLTDKYFDVCNPEIYGKEDAWSFEDNEIHMASHIYPLPEKLLNYLKDKYGYFKSYSQTCLLYTSALCFRRHGKSDQLWGPVCIHNLYERIFFGALSYHLLSASAV